MAKEDRSLSGTVLVAAESSSRDRKAELDRAPSLDKELQLPLLGTVLEAEEVLFQDREQESDKA